MSTTFHRRLSSQLEDFERAQKLWKDLNSHGFGIAQDLVNARTQASFASRSECWFDEVTRDFPDIKERFLLKMIPRIEELCMRVQESLSKLEIQYVKMTRITDTMSRLLEDASQRHGFDFAFNMPFYQTCSMEFIINKAIIVYSMYSKEISLKKHLVARLCDYTSDANSSISNDFKIRNKVFGSSGIFNGGGLEYDECMGILSMWLYEPNLNTNEIKEFVELLAIERT